MGVSFNKREIIDFVAQISDDCTVDEAIEQLRLLERIERGIDDADQGRVMDHDEFFDQLEAEDLI